MTTHEGQEGPVAWVVEMPIYRRESGEFDGPLKLHDDVYWSAEVAEEEACRYNGRVVPLYRRATPPSARIGIATAGGGVSACGCSWSNGVRYNCAEHEVTLPEPVHPSAEGEPHDRFAAAVRLASAAHAGQVYTGHGGRDDESYILHPLRVAMAVRGEGRTVAVLHDVEEDTDCPLPAWLTHAEKDALALLCREPGLDYEDYIGMIANARGTIAGDLAIEVKIADLRDNLSNHPPTRLRKRYEAALEMLGALPCPSEPEDITNPGRPSTPPSDPVIQSGGTEV